MHLIMFGLLGFDVGDLSEDGPDDVAGMDASAAHVANLLSTEPADSMFKLLLITLCYLFSLNGSIQHRFILLVTIEIILSILSIFIMQMLFYACDKIQFLYYTVATSRNSKHS